MRIPSVLVSFLSLSHSSSHRSTLYCMLTGEDLRLQAQDGGPRTRARRHQVRRRVRCSLNLNICLISGFEGACELFCQGSKVALCCHCPPSVLFMHRYPSSPFRCLWRTLQDADSENAREVGRADAAAARRRLSADGSRRQRTISQSGGAVPPTIHEGEELLTQAMPPEQSRSPSRLGTRASEKGGVGGDEQGEEELVRSFSMAGFDANTSRRLASAALTTSSKFLSRNGRGGASLSQSGAAADGESAGEGRRAREPSESGARVSFSGAGRSLVGGLSFAGGSIRIRGASLPGNASSSQDGTGASSSRRGVGGGFGRFGPPSDIEALQRNLLGTLATLFVDRACRRPYIEMEPDCLTLIEACREGHHR